MINRAGYPIARQGSQAYGPIQDPFCLHLQRFVRGAGAIEMWDIRPVTKVLNSDASIGLLTSKLIGIMDIRYYVGIDIAKATAAISMG
jgi:hypothetical protein